VTPVALSTTYFACDFLSLCVLHYLAFFIKLSGRLLGPHYRNIRRASAQGILKGFCDAFHPTLQLLRYPLLLANIIAPENLTNLYSSIIRRSFYGGKGFL
jgi:hypothetical protein